MPFRVTSKEYNQHMTKRGRKLHQTMQRRYAIARGEHPDPNRSFNFDELRDAVNAAWKSIQVFSDKVIEVVQAWENVIYPWYVEHKDEIDAALSTDQASVQREIIERIWPKGEQA
jgi:hypothetical protein